MFITEIGFKNNSLSFINAFKNFVKVYKKADADLLVAVVHNESGDISLIELVDINTGTAVATYNKQTCIEAAKNHCIKRFDALQADFKLGTLIQVPEFLVSMWEQVKPVALEKIA